MARDVDYNININDNGSMKTLGQLEDTAAQLNEEIRGVDRSSEAFGRLTMMLQDVEAEMMQVNSQIEGFTSDKRIMATQGAIDVFAGSIEAASGLAQQLGLNNEELDKVIANLLAVQSTANGIRTIARGYTDLRVALRGVTTAQLGFNTAALANPYVLAAAVIVTAIAAVVTQFDRFKEAVGDIGVTLPDFGKAWDVLGSTVSAVAAGIATQLGVLTRGFVQLFKGDFSGAFSSFSDALTFDSARAAAVEEFNEPTPEEADIEDVVETAKEVGRGITDAALCGVEEATEERPRAVAVLEGTGLVPRGLISVEGSELEGGDVTGDIEQTADTMALMSAAEALDAFEENLADKKMDREQRLSDGLKTIFADNVEVSKAIAIAEGAVAAGRSVKDTISSVRGINAAAALIPPLLPPGIPNPAYVPAQAARAANTAIEIGLGAVDLASIISNTAQTVSALDSGGGRTIHHLEECLNQDLVQQ